MVAQGISIRSIADDREIRVSASRNRRVLLPATVT